MTERNVHFKNMLEVTDFVKIASGFTEEILLLGDDYRADAKSLLGIFGMDISKPMRVSISGDAAGEQRVCKALQQYIV
ncbi:MAG: HPr family phosphocarrier protein [Lachnospiraceae bacterium]|nr:HPr family phosphocarrier protein [Lachnospiraceae bacterium]